MFKAFRKGTAYPLMKLTSTTTIVVVVIVIIEEHGLGPDQLHTLLDPGGELSLLVTASPQLDLLGKEL